MTTNEFKSLLHDLMVSPGSGIMKKLEEGFEYLQQVRVGLLEATDKLREERDTFKRCMDDELLRRQTLGNQVTELRSALEHARGLLRDTAAERNALKKELADLRQVGFMQGLDHCTATQQRDEACAAARKWKEELELVQKEKAELYKEFRTKTDLVALMDRKLTTITNECDAFRRTVDYLGTKRDALEVERDYARQMWKNNAEEVLRITNLLGAANAQVMEGKRAMDDRTLLQKELGDSQRLLCSARAEATNAKNDLRIARETTKTLERQVEHLAARAQELSETRITASEAQAFRNVSRQQSEALESLSKRYRALQVKLCSVRDTLDGITPNKTNNDCYGTPPEAQR